MDAKKQEMLAILKIIFALLLAWTPSSLAQAKMLVSCSTDHPTTSFFLEQKDEFIKLTVMHHHGVEFAPITDGLHTGHDLPLLQQRYKYTQMLGNQFSVLFKQCSFEGRIKSCFQNEKLKINDLEVEQASFSIHWENHQTSFGDFFKYVTRFEYKVDGVQHSLSMNYHGQEGCRFH